MHPQLLLGRKTSPKAIQRTSYSLLPSVPDPWPSSIEKFVNPVPSLQPLASTGQVSTSRRLKPRQPTTVQWCALGTEIYILLALQGSQSALAIKSTLATAIQQVESKVVNQTVAEDEMGVAVGSTPAYSLVGNNVKLNAANAAGASMTWEALEIGLLTMADWMSKNVYGWGSASVWNGTDEVGLIYITV